MKSIKWQVALSNGQQILEDNDFVSDVESSAWQKLLKYVQENNLEITSLSLLTSDNRTFNLPSGGKRPRFKAFYDVEKPIGFNFGHHIGYDVKDNSGEKHEELFVFIEAIYPNYRLQLWVDENNPSNCWCLVNTSMEVK